MSLDLFSAADMDGIRAELLERYRPIAGERVKLPGMPMDLSGARSRVSTTFINRMIAIGADRRQASSMAYECWNQALREAA